MSSPRRDEATLLPALLAGVLLIAVAAQFVMNRDPELPDASAGGPPPLARVGDPLPVLLDPVIGARPLFSPTRRPGDAPRATGPDGAATPLGGAIVAGSVKARGIARVMLKLPGGAVRSLATGETYRGWVLVGIGADGARFRRGADAMTVAYGSGDAAAPASEDQ